MDKFFKEPLLHFLIAGAALFFVSDFLGVKDDRGNRIIKVDRAALLAFLTYQAKISDELRVSKILDAMSTTEREQLINQYVHDEALHREALSLKLDNSDSVIKNRLIQKMEFIADSFAPDSIDISDKELEAYYSKHKSRYHISPSITFTHVFFDGRTRGEKTALSLAKTELGLLDEQNVLFSEALSYGDRFLYYANYVEKTPEFLVGHFGDEIVKRLFDNKVQIDKWQGPFKSDHGYHLVLIVKKSMERDPELSEIRQRIYEEAVKEARENAAEKAIQEIINTYKVELEI